MSTEKPYCTKMRAHFDAYHDDETSPFLRNVLKKHLQTCTPCRREYALLQMTIETVAQKTAPDVPARLLKKVVRELTGGGRGGTPIPDELVDPRLAEGTT
jgi:anti-sigma factor RsiW